MQLKRILASGLMVVVALLFACSALAAQEVPANVKAIIAKTASFGLEKYPISFWNYASLGQYGEHFTEEEVQRWADCGFTVPQSPSFDPKNPAQVEHMKRLLDWAHKRGMKLIVWDPDCYADKDLKQYAKRVKRALDTFGDHPGLFGFYIGDEPNYKWKDAFFRCSNLQKRLAPHLHPYLNLLPYFPGIEGRAGCDNWPDYLDEYVRRSHADLISYDCYVQLMDPDNRGWENYYQNLRLYREAALRNGVPFWNTLLSVGHFHYRCPNYNELRWQFNTTVACGAGGVLWFFYYMRQPIANYRNSPVNELWELTPTYYNIRLVQQSFHHRYKDLFNHLVCTKVMFWPKPFGGGRTFAPDGLVSGIWTDRGQQPVIISEFCDEKGQRYVMLVNNSMTNSINAVLTFPGKDVRVYSWDWYGNRYLGGAYSGTDAHRTENGLVIGHWLAPGQEAVYLVKSSLADKEPILPAD